MITDILVQVNISEEETKSGIDTADAIALVKDIAKLPNVRIKGLMTIAQETQNPEETRPVFQTLRNLSIDIKALNIDNISMDFLSMGMSGDFVVAIDEGANLVRIGTSIFGKRDYTKM